MAPFSGGFFEMQNKKRSLKKGKRGGDSKKKGTWKHPAGVCMAPGGRGERRWVYQGTPKAWKKKKVAKGQTKKGSTRIEKKGGRSHGEKRAETQLWGEGGENSLNP